MSSSPRVAVLALVLAASGPARAEDVIYYGAHPVHPAAGAGFCGQAEAHVHAYVPADPSDFLRRGGLWIFIGDPTLWGYTGSVFPFEAGHRAPEGLGGLPCSIHGPHYHLYADPYVTPEVVYVPVHTPVYVPFAPVWDGHVRHRRDHHHGRGPRAPVPLPPEVRRAPP